MLRAHSLSVGTSSSMSRKKRLTLRMAASVLMVFMISSRSSTTPIFAFLSSGRMSKMPPNGGMAVSRTVTASVVSASHSATSSKSLLGSSVSACSLPMRELARSASISRIRSYSMIL